MGFFDKMFSGLTKTRKNIEDLEEIFQNYDMDDMDFYDELEEMLVMADVGGETTAKILYDYKRILYRNRINKGRDAKKRSFRTCMRCSAIWTPHSSLRPSLRSS